VCCLVEAYLYELSLLPQRHWCHNWVRRKYITVAANLQLFTFYDVDRQQIPIIITVIFKLMVTHTHA